MKYAMKVTRIYLYYYINESYIFVFSKESKEKKFNYFFKITFFEEKKILIRYI